MNLFSERRNTMLQKLKISDYKVSSWSGGTTTQIAIWPPNALYADRDFLWRISSATVDLEESDFTPLPDYERLISTLEGEIVLTHNGGEPIKLRPFEVHAFSGADATHSLGRCRDFNLMLRRGKVTGTVEALRLTEGPTNLNAGTSIACPLPPVSEQLLLYCAEGTASAEAAVCLPVEAESSRAGHSERSAGVDEESGSLGPGEALLFTGPAQLTVKGPALLIVCRMQMTTPQFKG